jgi:hypothetical protein
MIRSLVVYSNVRAPEAPACTPVVHVRSKGSCNVVPVDFTNCDERAIVAPCDVQPCWVLCQVCNGLPCTRHKNAEGHLLCALPLELTTDMFFASGPCQPFSAVRRGPNSVAPEIHAGWPATFADGGSILNLVELLKPHVFGSEQVLGFSTPHKDRDGCPKADFMERTMAVTRDGLGSKPHFAAAAAIRLDSASFVEGSRPRWPACEAFVCISVPFADLACF